MMNVDLTETMIDKNEDTFDQYYSKDIYSEGEPTLKKFDLNEAILAAGDNGLYHILNLIFLSLVWVIIPSIPVMLPYFRMIPTFLCTDDAHPTLEPKTCTMDQICDKTVHKLNSGNPLKTWASDFNIYCDKTIYFGILGSLYFVGILIGNFFISKFTDSYGRKPVLVFFLITYLITSIITIFAWSLYVLFFVTFVVGVIYAGTSLCAFVLNYESSSKRMKTMFCTILSMSFGVGAIVHIIIFYYFENWIITVAITSVFCLILLVFTFHLQESPEFLLAKKKYKELIKALEYIAYLNSNLENLRIYIDNTNLQKLIDNKPSQSRKTSTVYGIIEVIGLPDQRLKLFLMAFNWFVMTLTFYGINFNVSGFGTNPFITGILVYLSETIAQGISVYFIVEYGFKFTISGSYLISGISLLFIQFLKNHIVLNFIFIFFAKFGISVVTNSNYIYTAELFPTMIRIASMSLCSLLSRFGGIFSTLVIEIFDYTILVFSILCLINAGVLLLIKENKK